MQIPIALNEVKKGLKCCADNTTTICFKCPFFRFTPCRNILAENALAIINEYETEIERMRKYGNNKDHNA